MRVAIPSRIWVFVAIVLLQAHALRAASVPRFLARVWQSEDGLPSNVVRGVAQASDGYLWVVTAEGIARFDGHRFTSFPLDSNIRSAWRSLRAIFPLANGELWVSTATNVLLRGRGRQLDLVELPATSGEGAAPPVSQVFLGEQGDVFVARGEEIWRIADGQVAAAERTATLERLLQEDAAAAPESGRSLRHDPVVRLRRAQGGIWEFRPNAGLTRIHPNGRVEAVDVQTELPSAVQGMCEDREGNLWLATQAQGLWQLRRARVDLLAAEGMSDRTALLVMEDRAGALWIAPQSGGLDRMSGGVVKHFGFGANPLRRRVSALLETRVGVLWAAARDARLYYWEYDTFVAAFPNDRRADKVAAMIEDDRGWLWIGGDNGVAVWNGSELKSVDLGSPQNVTVFALAGSTIWVGTESGRLFRGNAEKMESVPVADALAGQPITAILPDSDGGFWIGTMGAGLCHWRDGKIVLLASRMTEADARITCVLDDGQGYLWMGTLGGICRVHKARVLDASAAGDSTVVLDRSDGLLTRECTRGGEPAGWRGRDGTLYFATGSGVAQVRPETLSLNAIKPPVLIEEAGSGAQRAGGNLEQLHAGPGRSRVEIRYTALSFRAPEKVRFRTRLVGLDETWRDAGTQRHAIYEAVPPGKYRFQVVAENGDGVWNEVGASLGVEVMPHFWETRWFRASAAIVAAALAVAVGAVVMRARLRGRLLRMAAVTSREKERARIAQDLHDDLGASLTEISLLANLAAEERQAGSPEDDILPEVATKAQALVGALDEIVWAVNPRHDTLRSLAEYLSAFGGKFLSCAGMTLRRDFPRELPEVPLDAERRHQVFLATREAMNNAVKHSGASEVWLRVRVEEGELKIVVEDNGRGFSAEQDNFSEGLGSMRDRMRRVGGGCEIESGPSGARICLSLPLAPVAI